MSVKIFNFLWRVNNFQTTFLIVPPFQYVTGTMKKQDSQSLMDSGLPILLQCSIKGNFSLLLDEKAGNWVLWEGEPGEQKRSYLTGAERT